MDKDKTYHASMKEYSKDLCRRGCMKQIEEDKKSIQLIERLLIALYVMTHKDFDS